MISYYIRVYGILPVSKPCLSLVVSSPPPCLLTPKEPIFSPALLYNCKIPPFSSTFNMTPPLRFLFIKCKEGPPLESRTVPSPFLADNPNIPSESKMTPCLPSPLNNRKVPPGKIPFIFSISNSNASKEATVLPFLPITSNASTPYQINDVFLCGCGVFVNISETICNDGDESAYSDKQ